PEQPLLGLEERLERLRVRRVERGDPLLHRGRVDRERREEVLEQLAEPLAGPRTSELEPMRHLVEGDTGSEIGRVERPIAFERGEVRDDEEELTGRGSRDRDVVLPENLP